MSYYYPLTAAVAAYLQRAASAVCSRFLLGRLLLGPKVVFGITASRGSFQWRIPPACSTIAHSSTESWPRVLCENALLLRKAFFQALALGLKG